MSTTEVLLVSSSRRTRVSECSDGANMMYMLLLYVLDEFSLNRHRLRRKHYYIDLIHVRKPFPRRSGGGFCANFHLHRYFFFLPCRNGNSLIVSTVGGSHGAADVQRIVWKYTEVVIGRSDIHASKSNKGAAKASVVLGLQ